MSDNGFYKVSARVVSQKGHCAAGHKVGDEFIIEETTPKGMCCWAFCTIFPFVSVLQLGGGFPWEAKANETTVACPDPANPVVFELRRIEK